ncbi:SMP-30/gluconolactonase/LRE family protein [Solwaraspora sp. WMMD1047]|uniref:SMP-30/gluconolactonase/LRE family protein n=1 Tax=Solwaraspora sp. WMMD1047 TaxID=3016102 RepID=UPI002415DFFA|nr:SMP-30/gluconolactonase/LRE family protein [Solwaraspora sp. WMMD1047]MDG4834438.1 SMP-30/gluconolactonase/LRE family protein [Solwaraspora sp. WMMD1047]
MAAQPLTSAVAEHGEGPVWHPGWGGLRWVDMLAGDVLSLGADGAVGRTHLDSVAAVIRPRAGGGMVAALEDRFALVDPDGTIDRLPPHCPPGVRMNEGSCDPRGRLYAGSMAWDAAPDGGTLYRLDPDRSVRTVLPAVGISNGLAWSPDGSTAYYADTTTGRIDVFDDDPEAGLTGRRPFVRVPSEAGAPDGLTVDADGGVWVALWGGSAVHRYTPDGRLDDRIELPVRQVTACTFGGDRLDELFITTSRQGLTDPEPLAGALFHAPVGIAGLPVAPFAG